jgi:hypothetical protein
MFGNIDARYSAEGLVVYNDVVKEAEEEFKKKVGTLTVFHKLLIDRVADAYVKLACPDSSVIGLDNKSQQDVLQKWLNTALSELHSAVSEISARQLFFERIVDILDAHVRDEQVRKTILVEMREAVKEGG